MALWDRRCTECNYKEYDLFEQKYEDTKICPSCGKLLFVKVYSAPHLPPSGLYSFNQALDNNRAKAAEGHGNASYKI